jgi:hypothetical protein
MTDVRPEAPAAGARRASSARPEGVRASLLSGLFTLLVIAALLAAYAFAPWNGRLDTSAVVELAIWLVVLAAVLVWHVRAVMRSAHPWLRAVQGAALGVALLLLPFAAAYARMSYADPATFTQPLTRIDAFYFTVTVFATVGFGDISAVTEAARVLVTVQMLVDLVLIGTVVKVLVGAAQRRREALGPRRPRPDDAH